MQYDLEEPPLWGFWLYIRLLTQRIYSYTCLAAVLFYGALSLVCQGRSALILLKRFSLKILMRRGGFFAPAPRLGLVTVSGSLVFSLVLMPVAKANAFNSEAATQDSGADSNNLAVLSETEANTRIAEAAASEKKNRVPETAPETDSGEAPADDRSQPLEYKVQPGDTLFSIGQEFLVSVEALAYTNNLADESFLSVGQKLIIPPVNGLVHKVKRGENVSLIAQEYGVSPQAIVDYNLLSAPYLVHAGDELVIPEVKKIPSVAAPFYGASLAARQGGQAAAETGLALQPLPGASGALQHPLPGSTVTQFFQSYHPAVDFARTGCGAPVVAAESGSVYFAGWWAGGGGNTIMIDHGGGLVTKYAHLQGFARGAGAVSRGEVIGYVGDTGRAYGCHLHFIVQRDGRFVNPLGEL